LDVEGTVGKLDDGEIELPATDEVDSSALVKRLSGDVVTGGPTKAILIAGYVSLISSDIP
jgi:hypothetical protein